MNSKLLASIIISSAVVLAIASVWNDSPIVDEIPHIGAGYSYIVKGDFRLNPEHPPLSKDIAGLTLSFLPLSQGAFETKFWNEDINGQWNFGRNLIFNSGNDAILMARVAKIPLLLFFILSAIIIFHWTRKLYGKTASLIATFLFSFSPTVIAHSRFVTTDMAALFGILLATYFFIEFLKHQNKTTFVVAFIAFGVAQLTKFSLFLLNPFFLILAVVWGLNKNDKAHSTFKSILLTGGVVVFGYFLVVWPFYGLHTRNYPAEIQKRDTIYHLGTYGNRLFADRIVEASDKPYIRSLAHYGLGVLMVTPRSIGGKINFFFFEN